MTKPSMSEVPFVLIAVLGLPILIAAAVFGPAASTWFSIAVDPMGKGWPACE